MQLHVCNHAKLRKNSDFGVLDAGVPKREEPRILRLCRQRRAGRDTRSFRLVEPHPYGFVGRRAILKHFEPARHFLTRVNTVGSGP